MVKSHAIIMSSTSNVTFGETNDREGGGDRLRERLLCLSISKMASGIWLWGHKLTARIFISGMNSPASILAAKIQNTLQMITNRRAKKIVLLLMIKCHVSEQSLRVEERRKASIASVEIVELGDLTCQLAVGTA